MQRAEQFISRFYPSVTAEEWGDWRWQLRQRIQTPEQLSALFAPTESELAALQNSQRLPFAITPYYASLLWEEAANGPLRRTLVPVVDEFSKSIGESPDPLSEDPHRPVSAIVHRYPDRVLFLATGNCAVYCRYCTRSRLVGQPEEYRYNKIEWEKGFQYIESHPEVRDVLITGGDPLTLSDDILDSLLSRLRSIRHVEFIRIGTKVPMALPQRVTPQLTAILKKYHPLWMSLHIIHPKELTAESKLACERLADAGIPLGSQTVLLKGINDESEVVRELMLGLLKIRVKPYYLFHCDPLEGSAHFRTPVEKGVEILRDLRGRVTGYAIPHYALDLPGRGGKITLSPDYIKDHKGDFLAVENYEGEPYLYPEG